MRSVRLLQLVLLGILAASCENSSPTNPSPSPPTSPSSSAALSGITLASSSATAGDTVTGTVTLGAAASSGGFAVELALDHPDAATVPPSIVVPAGATSRTFTITVDDDVAFPRSITIAATAAGVTRTAVLEITPVDGVGPIRSFATAHDDVIGGDDTTATVALTAPAPADGVRFALSSDDDRVTVPPSLVIPAGETSGTFDIDTAPVPSVVEAHITLTLDPTLALRGARRGTKDVATAAASMTLTLILLPEPDDTPEHDDTSEPAPNTAPTISSIADQTIEEDTGTGPLEFTVADGETEASSLIVSGTSSNATLVPDANIVFGGSGTDRTVTVTPAADETGSATITITVSDGDITTDTTFTLTVTAGNTAPTISSISSQQLYSDGATGPLSFTIGDAETDAASLIVTATSSNTALVPETNIVLGGSGANRTITVTVAPGETGSASITVTVSDGDATTDERFSVYVDPRPPAPTLTGVKVASSAGVRALVIEVELLGTNFDLHDPFHETTVEVSGGVVVTDVAVGYNEKFVEATFTNDGQPATSAREVTVTTAGGSATLTVATPPTPTSLSVTGLENARCIEIDVGDDPNPAAETDVIVTQGVARGYLYTSELAQLVLVGTPVDATGGLCFVPEPYDFSDPADEVYATFEYRLRSYTVAGPIESPEGVVGTVEIIVLPADEGS